MDLKDFENFKRKETDALFGYVPDPFTEKFVKISLISGVAMIAFLLAFLLVIYIEGYFEVLRLN